MRSKDAHKQLARTSLISIQVKRFISLLIVAQTPPAFYHILISNLLILILIVIVLVIVSI